MFTVDMMSTSRAARRENDTPTNVRSDKSVAAITCLERSFLTLVFGLDQVPGLSCIWRGFQAWDILQDSADDSSIDKIETSSERQHFFRFQNTTDVLPCHIHLPVYLWIMYPHSRAAKKNTSHGNEVLPQDTTHLIQRPRYQRGSPCQDSAGNRTTLRPPDHCK